VQYGSDPNKKRGSRHSSDDSTSVSPKKDSKGKKREAAREIKEEFLRRSREELRVIPEADEGGNALLRRKRERNRSLRDGD